ncbi:dTDP-4-amino-4,6-dideoxygalactose transaminase [Rhodococcus sp. NPDC003318]|uniref:dTDP-4-amino-4,6-dideoxygalactose transaminase n=1 Tax=Rhodococcus sp. NPDC003318 TaxID=3364503 RepID=UPI0036B2E935
MTGDRVIFSRPYVARREMDNLAAALASGHLHGDGPFTAAATTKLREITSARHVLLTTSCTHALELSAILLDLAPGDEVIVPSFAFTSAATSLTQRGATPVFVDIDPDTGNVDPSAVADAITPRTRAVVVMHYGGVAADMESLLGLAAAHGITLIEDNAHGLGGTWRGRPLGTIGTFGTQSFHDTKNVHCGEGGALLLTDDLLAGRAEIIREKGTDRARFLRGQVDKYSWQDVGSSYLPSELNAAVLDAQLDEFETIQSERHRVWNSYASALGDWAQQRGVTLMTVPDDCGHTAHLFYLRMPDESRRDGLIDDLAEQGVVAPFHYVPLDTSPAGRKYGRTPRPCTRSAEFASTIVRLPLWPGLDDDRIGRVVDAVTRHVW